MAAPNNERVFRGETDVPLRVGDRVRVRIGRDTIEGEVIEDRGAIGVGGRRLVRVKAKSEEGDERLFEMPADFLERIETDT